MTVQTRNRIPAHLRRFIVDQNYERYTPEDQAVWRYIMRQLKNFLGQFAHSSYLEGLQKTGITVDRIPSIGQIDEHLEKIGWGAVPVSGFIPPAAFMEFQSIGILPIASDMRSVDHLLYTPAPDIVHEAAGHAPILANPDYAAYLRQYGEVARRAILSFEDLAQYEAIRFLSDIKEDPISTREDIEAAEHRLNEVNQNINFVSEAALLSRMNWWTAEYGLIGDMRSPRIFGAGLLSSVGESRHCLNPGVQKIPLTVDCVNFSYDITEPQPQLFVTRDFGQLGEVLEQLADQLAFKRGGTFGLRRAQDARTVNTVQLDSGVQISGRLKNFLLSDDGEPAYLQFDGGCQLSTVDREMPGHGVARHAHGYSCPVGLLKGNPRPLHSRNPQELAGLGLKKGEMSTLEFASGVVVHGRLESAIYNGGVLHILTFKNCRVMWGANLLFDPSWGEYDMATGTTVMSVFGGPADRERFPESDEFVARIIPDKVWSPDQRARHSLYAKIRNLRERPGTAENVHADFKRLLTEVMASQENEWLPALELLEIGSHYDLPRESLAPLEARLNPERFSTESVQMAVSDGLSLVDQKL